MLVRLALWVITIKAVEEQVELKLGWWTSGWIGYDWETFVAAHPEADQLYIDKNLKSRLYFSSRIRHSQIYDHGPH